MPLTETPIAALAVLSRKTGTESGFLEAHHMEAAHRIRVLFERSHLRTRVTMHYGPRVGSSRSSNDASDIPQMAADARKRLSALLGALPAECRSIVLDVCCLEKGLQDIEKQRSWPRRSAKLVLRIALDRLAELYGLASHAEGTQTSRPRNWQDEGAKPRELS